MVRVRRDEALVEHQRGLAESRLEVTVRPLVGRLAGRQLTPVEPGEVPLRPLHFLDLGRGRRRVGCRRARRPYVAARAGVRPAGPQRIDWIDVERQELPVDLDLLDRL